MPNSKNPSLDMLPVVFLVFLIIQCSPAQNRTASQTSTAQAAENATISSVATTVDAGPLLTAAAHGESFKARATSVAPTLTALPLVIHTVIPPTSSPPPRELGQTATSTPSPITRATPLPLLPSPTLTPTIAPTSGTAGAIVSFALVPTTTHALGELVTARWETRSGTASLCPYNLSPSGPIERPGECQTVLNTGTMTLTTTTKSLDWDGILLRVNAGQTTTDRAVISLVIGCQGYLDWFFQLAPERCPQDAAIQPSATFEPFEHGFMVWLKQPDTFYVFTDDTPNSGQFHFQPAPYTFKPGASPDNRISEKPPSGLYEPVSGFGQIWRGEMESLPDVRAQLGWATAPESAFDSAYQCARVSAGFSYWHCYLRLPDGKILSLHPDSTAQVHFVWEEQ